MKGFQRKITIGMTIAKTMEFKRINLDEARPVNSDKVAKAVRASSSLPLMFNPVSFAGVPMIDGGVSVYIDVEGAIARCLEIV